MTQFFLPQRGKKGKSPIHDSECDSDVDIDDLPPDLKEEHSEPDDLTCAICLGSIALADIALVKGCDHMYCAKCILHWTLHKEKPYCPQCKQPFNYLFTYRALDGTLQDFPSEESVTLLKRARWFEDHVKAFDHGSAALLLEESTTADDLAWHEYADDLDLAEDDVIEEFYFSAAAGRARVTIGNRRFGEGGYIASGRRQARPKPPRSSGGKGKTTPSPVARPPKGMPIVSPPSRHLDSKASCPAPIPGALGTSPSGSSLYGSSPSGSGRRARRNAKRAAMDGSVAASPSAISS